MRKGLSMRYACLLLSALVCQLPLAAVAQSVSSWQALPEETLAALRIPNGQVYAQSLVRDTKLGKVLFSEQRKAKVLKILDSSDAEAWEKFQSKLEEYQFTTDDLLHLLAGESGYAVVTQQADDALEVFGLAWLEPGDELATRAYAAVEKMIEDQDDERPVTRVDVAVAGEPVMQLQAPAIEVVHEEEFELGDEYDDLPDEEQEQVWDKAYAEWEESATEVVTHRTMLVCKMGGRLLVAHHYDSYDDEASAAAVERLTDVFGRWLSAHADESGEFAQRVTEEPGAARVMSLEGESMFELLGDFAPLVQLLKTHESLQEYGELAARLGGLDGVGEVATKVTAQGPPWRTRMSFAAPAERTGLMRMLNQESLPIEPSAWVPATTVSYYQLSFDLGEAYEIIKEEVMREFPDQAAGGFAMAEAQVQGFAKASLPEVLRSLGNRHTVLSFGLETSGGGDAAAVGTERIAMVWQLDDEPLWQRLLTALTPFAGMAQGVESADEQGFNGWRMKSAQVEGGLMVGNGHMVLAYGTGVLESVLSSLNNPPQGSDALRGSAVFARAAELLDLDPSLGAEVTDGDRYMQKAITAMEKQFKQLAELAEQVDGDNDDNDGERLLLPLVDAIMPTSEEIRGMMGVIVTRYEVNDDGIFSETAQEMPAP